MPPMIPSNIVAAGAAPDAPDIIERAVADGIQLDNPDALGRRLLHVACMMGNPAAVEAALQNGASHAAVDHVQGATPLHIAAGGGFAEGVHLLIEAGADREARCAQHKTPAQWSERNSYPPLDQLAQTGAERMTELRAMRQAREEMYADPEPEL